MTSTSANPASSGRVLHFDVAGMSCASCVTAVQRGFAGASPDADVRVNLADASARVVLEPQDPTSAEAFVAAVARAGYQARLSDEAETIPGALGEEESAAARRRFLEALALTLPAALTMWFAPPGLLSLLVQGVLAGLIQVGPGRVYYRNAARSLGHGAPSMDVLIALGTSAAFGYSILSAFGVLGEGTPVFFETAAFLITFISLGKWLEARSRGKARSALVSLLELAPATARRIEAGEERAVRATELGVGDRIVVLPGERIAADGVIRRGSSAVDESMLTGESEPVEKSRWDDVVGGTLNRSGRIEVEITATGKTTVLAGIVRMVREAQAESAPIQRLADRVSGVFVPVVIVLALATGALWMAGLDAPFVVAFSYAVAVVVIACPCALGLATPTAILVGSAMGLRHGILVKSGAALEQLGRVTRVLLDKTGTLTEGRFSVVACHPAGDLTEDELLGLAGALERGSQHPLATAVVAAATARGLELPPLGEVTEREGLGVEGDAGGRRVILGRPSFLADRGVTLPAPADASPEGDASSKGATSRIAVAVDGRYAGEIHLADTLRPEAASVVTALREAGVTPVLVTGDARLAALAVARTLGIEEVHAEVHPGDKHAIVKRERERGVVAMVGDGINDAPALAAADVGVAIGSGTDAAKETGDVILVRSDLRDLLRAWLLSRATLRRVRLNLGWAFLYNVLGIPVAAGALSAWGVTLRPEFAGLAMALSSVSVVTSSLLLRRQEPRIFSRN